jgi:hypothetical protein
MTEEEWLNEQYGAQRMIGGLDSLRFHRTKTGRRKLRLYAVGCGLIVADKLPDERLRQAIHIAERYADGLALKAELAAIRSKVHPLRSSLGPFRNESIEVQVAVDIAVAATEHNPKDAAFYIPTTRMPLAGKFPWEKAKAVLCRMLRRIVGNPFRPVAFAPEWRTTVAVGIAAQIYESREFGNLPVLADALEDAGCDHPAVLAHCREPGEHARGCWVVDGVLGKG